MAASDYIEAHAANLKPAELHLLEKYVHTLSEEDIGKLGQVWTYDVSLQHRACFPFLYAPFVGFPIATRGGNFICMMSPSIAHTMSESIASGKDVEGIVSFALLPAHTIPPVSHTCARTPTKSSTPKITSCAWYPSSNSASIAGSEELADMLLGLYLLTPSLPPHTVQVYTLARTHTHQSTNPQQSTQCAWHPMIAHSQVSASIAGSDDASGHLLAYARASAAHRHRCTQARAHTHQNLEPTTPLNAHGSPSSPIRR